MAAVDARVLLAIDPPNLLLFDEKRGEVTDLPTYDRPLYGLAGEGRGNFWAAGAGTLLHFEIRRLDTGALAWSARGAVSSSLGVVTAAATQGETLALATESGSLLLVDSKRLSDLPVLARSASN